MINERDMHFWIPNEEVQSIVKRPMGGGDKRIVSFKEHGSKLSHNPQTIKKLTKQSKAENSLREKDIVIFNVELPEKIKIQDKPNIFSSNGQKIMLQEHPPETVDIQRMLIPDLDSGFYESALKLLSEKIKRSNGSIPDSVCYLSDNTPVVRAIIPSSTLSLYENDQAIYRIKKTNFFNVDADSIPVKKLEGLTLNPGINLTALPNTGRIP